MLRHFGSPAPADYLASHPDEYVITVKLPLGPADMPRRADGSVDIAAFPERIFGPGHVKHHPDGSAEYIDVPESKFQELDQRVLHRATCGTLRHHDDQYQMICGTRGELEEIMQEYDKLCPAVCNRGTRGRSRCGARWALRNDPRRHVTESYGPALPAAGVTGRGLGAGHWRDGGGRVLGVSRAGTGPGRPRPGRCRRARRRPAGSRSAG
jgi:hypothetical protein